MSIIVERVSGQALRDFAHEHIFEPLEMDRTHYHDRHDEVVEGREVDDSRAPAGAGQPVEQALGNEVLERRGSDRGRPHLLHVW